MYDEQNCTKALGYHLREIKPHGVYGEASKIFEELDEFKESLEQGSPIMALLELSDLLGAIEAYTISKHSISLADLVCMSDATKRAFESGQRNAKAPPDRLII